MESIKKVTVVFLVLCLVIARFLFLDQDTPPYAVAAICQEDELYYSLGAVSKYNADHDRLIKGLEHVNGEGLMLYTNYITYWSLSTFGNNYWGLRLPVVLVSLLVVLLLYDILRKLKVSRTYLLLALLYVFTDFYFFLFSRFLTPQIYSILAITWVLWLYFKYRTNKGLFLIGFFVIFAVSFVYLYNMFLIMVFGLLVIYRSYHQKRGAPLLYFSLGMVSCLVVYSIALHLMHASFSEIITVLTTHGGGIDGKVGEASAGKGILAALKTIYARLIQLPLTNLFRYNLSVLFIFLFSLPFVIFKGFRQKSEMHLLLLAFIFALCLQAFFAVSYPYKKLIVIFPVVVIIIAHVLPEALSHYRQLAARPRIYLLCYGMVGLGLCFLNFKINNSQLYWEQPELQYENTGRFYNILNASVLCITVFLLIINLLTQRLNYKVVFILPAFIGIIPVVRYTIIGKTFYSKNGFESAKPLLADKGVILSVSYAAQLYTDCKPGLSCYMDKSVFGSRYDSIATSLFKSGAAEFTIEPAKYVDSPSKDEHPNLEKVMTIPMKCYYLQIYKYKRDEAEAGSVH